MLVTNACEELGVDHELDRRARERSGSIRAGAVTTLAHGRTWI